MATLTAEQFRKMFPQANNEPVTGALATGLQAIADPLNQYRLPESMPVVGGMSVADFTGLTGAQGVMQDFSRGNLQSGDMRMFDLLGLGAGAAPAARTALKGGGLLGKEALRQMNEGTGLLGKVAIDPRQYAVTKTDYEKAFDLAQKRAALPIEDGGLGLPANNTAMDRAKAMGFDVNSPMYHGTNKDFTEFDVNVGRGKGFNTGANVTDNPYLANTYTTGINSGNVMPLYIKDNSAMVVEAGGKNWNRLGQSTKVKAPAISVVDKETNDLLAQLGVESSNNPVVKKQFNKTLKKMFPDEFLFDDYFTTDDLSRFARSQGYGSAKFNDIVDVGSSGMMMTEKSGLPSKNQVIFDPSLIRSRFAAFDPFRRNEADILAGVAAAPVGLMNFEQEKPKKKRTRNK